MELCTTIPEGDYFYVTGLRQLCNKVCFCPFESLGGKPGYCEPESGSLT